MIAALIRWSIANRVLVVIAAFIVAAAGVYAVKETPVDALPDLSDVQVIVKTSFPGAKGSDSPGLLVFRRLLRLCHF